MACANDTSSNCSHHLHPVHTLHSVFSFSSLLFTNKNVYQQNRYYDTLCYHSKFFFSLHRFRNLEKVGCVLAMFASEISLATRSNNYRSAIHFFFLCVFTAQTNPRTTCQANSLELPFKYYIPALMLLFFLVVAV